MKNILLASLFLVLIISSCKLKEDTTGTDTENNNSTTTTIKVLTPNGNEILSEGSSYQITWSGTGTTLVKIQYSVDNGTSWSLIVDSLKNTGVYSWFPIPNTISNQCRMQVTSVDGKSTDASDNVFSIIRNSNQSLKISFPKEKEEWEGGSAKQIKWFSSGIDSVKIEYTTNNGIKWNLVAIDKKNTGIYYWEPVPNTPSTLARVRIMDAKDGEPSSESDVFNILPESKIKVLVPNGNELIIAGTKRKIEWISENIENVKIAYTSNNGFEWKTIVESTPSVGYYEWLNIPSINSQLCKVRIYDAKDNEPSDVSDEVFTISNQITRTIELISPAGGENWQAGTNQSINWKSTGIQKVHLRFSTTNGLTWNKIADNLDNIGGYEWNVPNLASKAPQCLIKVSDAVDTTLYSQSKSTLTISPIPKLKLLKPNGGESWTAGIIDTIKWQSVGVENVVLEYTPNNGINWFTIIEKTPSSGSYITSFSAAGTQYKIRITDKENGSPQDESDGTFTVSPEPKIVVLEPNGNEEWYAGSANNIKWTSINIENVKIEYTTNNGASWSLITSSTPSDGVYSWDKIPNVSSLQCRVRISDAIDNIPSDMSDENFTITTTGNQLIKVTKPNGGEQWPLGTPQEITWDASGITNVKIEYTTNNGLNWNVITSSSPSNGYFIWTQVPSTASTNCKIRISDAADLAPTDESDAFFSIVPAPSIKVLLPNGNDTWISRTSREIKWTSENIANVKIEYTTNAGGTWQTIVASTPSSGSYLWNNIPNANNSLQCRIKISDAQNGIPFDLSDDNFAIMDAGSQQIKVVSPNNGEKWNVGSMQNIIWDAGGIANVKLEYTTNNGSSWTTIVESTPSNGYYTWSPIPNTPGTNCKIRISDAADNDPIDLSDNFFSILPAPTIKVISPNGGETLQTGTSTEIKWTSENVLNVKIEYTTNGGAIWNTITNSTESIGTYTWNNIPNVNSLQCRIRITDAANGTSSDISDNNFAITNLIVKSITVTSPVGGEDWEAGTTQNITWSTTAVTKLKIELTTNKGLTWTTIATDVEGGAYEWSINENLNSTQCQIRLSDVTDSKVSNISPSTFTISPRKWLTVTGPVSKTYKSNEPVTITWQSGGIKYVGIKYTTTNGVADAYNPAFTTLVEKVGATSGSYSTFFSKPSDKYFVVVYNADDNADGTPSNNSPGFTIEAAGISNFTLKVPNGGEQWLSYPIHNTYKITWHATSVQNVKIQLSVNGGSTWTSIVDSTPNDGEYSWTPSASYNSDNCLIKLSDVDDPTQDDVSDGFFSLRQGKILTVDYPNTGEDFYKGSGNPAKEVMAIGWTSYAVSSVNIYYSLDNGVTWNTLATNYTSTGIYLWNYDALLQPSKLGRIKIEDSADPSISDVNDVPFWLNIQKVGGKVIENMNKTKGNTQK